MQTGILRQAAGLRQMSFERSAGKPEGQSICSRFKAALALISGCPRGMPWQARRCVQGLMRAQLSSVRLGDRGGLHSLGLLQVLRRLSTW